MIKKERKILIIVLAISFIFSLLINFNKVYAYETTKKVRPLKTGDIIYYDNSVTQWNTVKIYFYSNNKDENGNPVTGSEKFPWASSPEMTKVDGTDYIYKYEITSDLEIENNYDNHVIFQNGSGKQTINLGFIDTGYVFKADRTNSAGRYDGDWYVYDKTELINLIATANTIKNNDSSYYTNTSIQELEAQITNADGVVNGEVLVTPVNIEGKIYYTNTFYQALESLNNAINALVLNKELDTIIDEDKYIPSSVDEYNTKIAEIRQEIDNNNALTINDMKTAEQRVQTAKNALVEKPDKTTLQANVTNGSAIDKSKYTTESVAILNQALAGANQVLQNVNAVTSDVTTANDNLVSAINGLQEVTTNSTDSNNENTNSNNTNSNNTNSNTNNDNNSNNNSTESTTYTRNNPKTSDKISLILAILGVATATFVIVEILKRKNKK